LPVVAVAVAMLVVVVAQVVLEQLLVFQLRRGLVIL
jgi:hypothetical protein